MIMRILKAALVAGFVAGLATAVLQHFTTTPLILQAEVFESGDAAAVGGERLVLVHGDADGHDAGHGDETGVLGRTATTSIVTIGTAFGFALVLLSAMVLAGAEITPRSGLLWGVAGFVATGLAPSLGLSPELPGAAAADLIGRQYWWMGTAAATAAALWLALRVSSPIAIGAAVVLALLPHVIGAPQADGFASAAPAELSAEFAAASLVVQAVLWSLSGAVAGYVWQRSERGQTVEA
jgi:cobalt transporter subunit CbtA